MNNGTLINHVIRKHWETPLDTRERIYNWLYHYEIKSPLVAVGTLISWNRILRRSAPPSYNMKKVISISLSLNTRNVSWSIYKCTFCRILSSLKLIFTPFLILEMADTYIEIFHRGRIQNTWATFVRRRNSIAWIKHPNFLKWRNFLV